jgi:site-specific DNA-methyltransferase (adenine-specific)
MQERKATSTSAFGVSRRENHDASGFYDRFHAPEVSADDTVAPPMPVAEPFVCGDARTMTSIADGTVALVVTSPPYFAGKEYEQELERDGVPSSYLEYLQLLRDVFAECVRTLEPGGRIAVNVANLGRKPYRSLSADVIHILQDDLGLLLRGEIIWRKGEGASGSCAWGSFRGASNPVLRDLTERIVIASKGRFDRAKSIKARDKDDLPNHSTMTAEDFMSLTLDVWDIPTESARRVGHPAPFPVELPEQLIRLYTFENDLVLDPFMGSGSALVAAARLGRRYVGYDLDPTYVDIARQRVAETHAAPPLSEHDEPTHHDKVGKKLAEQLVADAGFTITATDHKVRGTGVTVSLVAEDAHGERWLFDVAGPFTSSRGGMTKMETVWRALGQAHALRGRGRDNGEPLVILTTALPKRSSQGDTALRAAGRDAFFDAIDLLSDDGKARLKRYAEGGRTTGPEPGFWTAKDLAPGSPDERGR